MTLFQEQVPSGNEERDERSLEDLVYFLSESEENNEPRLLQEELREGIKRIINNGTPFTILYNDAAIYSVEMSPVQASEA
ncbi:hypothetical protein FJZ27_03045 [Candidatus Peribacteria bacterium]|nr:hypothetical protein [Candidatus Peribacteria bacterium]